MISEMRFRSKRAYLNVEVWIDGKKVDTVQANAAQKEGTVLDSPAIAAALSGRKVVSSDWVGDIVEVVTAPE